MMFYEMAFMIKNQLGFWKYILQELHVKINNNHVHVLKEKVKKKCFLNEWAWELNNNHVYRM